MMKKSFWKVFEVLYLVFIVFITICLIVFVVSAAFAMSTIINAHTMKLFGF